MKININGTEIEVERVSFETISEPWCKYQLSDGTILRIKPVVNGIIRAEGEWNGNGDPIYHISSPIMIGLDAVPDALRKENHITKAALEQSVKAGKAN